ncbi:MAG: hypothetical protein WC501_01330 [Candidatus Micrarchaeia archaeon]
MIELFTKRKPSKLLICLKNSDKEWTLNLLCTESKMTYVYLMRLIPKMKGCALITEDKKGRKKILKLTEKGMKVASLLEEMERIENDTTS